MVVPVRTSDSIVLGVLHHDLDGPVPEHINLPTLVMFCPCFNNFSIKWLFCIFSISAQDSFF